MLLCCSSAKTDNILWGMEAQQHRALRRVCEETRHSISEARSKVVVILTGFSSLCIHTTLPIESPQSHTSTLSFRRRAISVVTTVVEPSSAFAVCKNPNTTIVLAPCALNLLLSLKLLQPLADTPRNDQPRIADNRIGNPLCDRLSLQNVMFSTTCIT